MALRFGIGFRVSIYGYMEHTIGRRAGTLHHYIWRKDDGADHLIRAAIRKDARFKLVFF